MLDEIHAAMSFMMIEEKDRDKTTSIGMADISTVVPVAKNLLNYIPDRRQVQMV
jgi:hypothetical protein